MFCTRCGANAEAGARFCASCGQPLGTALGLAPATPPVAAATTRAWWDARPVGRKQQPSEVVLLFAVTLTIYSWFWLWRVTKEADAWSGEPGRRNARVKIALGVLVAGILVAAFAVFGAIGAALSGMDPDAEPDPEALAQALEGSPAFTVATLAAAAPGVALAWAAWSVWRFVRDDQARRGVAKPLQPGLLLALTLTPLAVTLLGFAPGVPREALQGLSILSYVPVAVAYYRTQQALNEVWAAAEASQATGGAAMG